MPTVQEIEAAMEKLWMNASGIQPEYMWVDGEKFRANMEQEVRSAASFNLREIFPTLGDARRKKK